VREEIKAAVIMRLAAYTGIFVIGVLCVLCACAAMGPAKKGSGKLARKADVLTVFLTGNELGSIKPCGCSGGQLGGLSRRPAVLNTVPWKNRLVVDTGSLVEGDSEQDLLKFSVIIRAFGLLGYDLVNLAERDLEIARNLGLLETIGPKLHVVSAPGAVDVNVPGRFTKRMLLNGKTVAVTIGSFDVRSGRIEQVERLFGPVSEGQTVKILILNGCDPAAVDSVVKKIRFVDCVVCPDDSDRPRVIGSPDRRPLVFSVGRLGKYVGKLEIGAAKTKGRLKFNFSAVPVTEDLTEEKALVQLYEEYQTIVRDSGLLASQARVSLSGGLRYMGSESCKACHKNEYQKWKRQAHADAYATLEKVGSAYDPECVVCHVVGMRYESGFVTPERTAGFKDVGCENCHGPGSEHIETEGRKPTGEPRSRCQDCHTPDNSADYYGNEAEYFEKTVHWGEPNAAGGVKDSKTGDSNDL